MRNTSSRIAATLWIAGLVPFVASGCGDDTSSSEPGIAGTSADGGGSGAGGQVGTGKGGSAQAGKNAGGAKNYAGSLSDGGEGGDDSPSSGGSGGKGGVGGTTGAGGGSAAGAGGLAGGGGTPSGGASGVSGGGGGGTTGGGGGGGGGGTTGGSGSGGSAVATCGNGVLDAGEACDPRDGKYAEDDCGAVWGSGRGETGASSSCQVITPLVCTMCEEQSDCAQLTDSSLLKEKAATAGPAIGIKRAVLYNETMDCVRDTKCANGLPIDCYCGTATSAQCDAGNGNGTCRTVIERGLETTNPTEIQVRYLSLEYGAGVALARINCDQQNCLEVCFPAAP